jgi:hypothetical protein
MNRAKGSYSGRAACAAELKKRYRYETIYSTAPDAGVKVEI